MTLPWKTILISLLSHTLAQRQSPELASSITSGLRSNVMLPARSLTKRLPTHCDSLNSGPFCAIANNKTRVLADGIIDRRVWGDIPATTYYNMYMSLSEYAQVHWDGSTARGNRSTQITTLSSDSDNNFTFSPHPMHVDVEALVPSLAVPSRQSLYTLNSIYGFISFVYHSVSVTELTITAPSDSDVLVRAHNEGRLSWSRLVEFGTTLDVTLPSDREDPSMEPVDILEIIGVGAQVVSLSVSFNQEIQAKATTYLLMGMDFVNPPKYAGIRELHPSAHLVDMQTALEENLSWVQDIPLMRAGQDEVKFGYSNFLQTCIAPVKYLDSFLLSLVQSAEPSNSFDEHFSAMLIGSSPQLLAGLLATNSSSDVVVCSDLVEKLEIIKAAFGKSFQPVESLFEDDPELEELFKTIQQTISPEPIQDPHESELERLHELRTALIDAFSLDIDENTPVEVQMDLLSAALQALLSQETDVQSLAEILVK